MRPFDARGDMKSATTALRIGLTWICLAAAAAVISGCATPAHRIRKQPELFASYPAEAQALIQAGRIDLGFDPGMVQMALGSPTDVYHTRNEQGEATVWVYRDLSLDYSTSHHYLGLGMCPHGPGCRLHACSSLYYSPPPAVRHKSAERLRITFRGGIVAEIQSLDRSAEHY